MKKCLGLAPLGFISVECWIDTDRDDGAGFSLNFSKGKPPQVTIGLKCTKRMAFNALLHEAIEFQLCHQDLRFVCDSKIDNDPSNFLFVFTHVQFQEVLNRSTEFIEKFYPLIMKEMDAIEAAKKHKAWKPKPIQTVKFESSVSLDKRKKPKRKIKQHE